MSQRGEITLPDLSSSINRESCRSFPSKSDVFPTLEIDIDSLPFAPFPQQDSKKNQINEDEPENSLSFWESIAESINNPEEQLEKWTQAVIEQKADTHSSNSAPENDINSDETKTKLMELLQNLLQDDSDEE